MVKLFFEYFVSEGYKYLHENIFLCSLTSGEIRKGLTKLPESKKKKRLTNWLNTLLENYQDRIHSINITVAENWGVM